MNPFPSELPPNVNDRASIQQHDWRAFRALSYMENHWQRPGWHPGRRSYHWMLSFHNAGEVRELAKACQLAVESPHFDLVPIDTLHLTIGRLGFTDEISKDAALDAAKTARVCSENIKDFQLTVGPLAGSRGALRFSVAPWAPLISLHRKLAEITREELGDSTIMDTRTFRPHLSIAYANSKVSVALMLPVLEQLRRLDTVTAIVSSVSLVELRRNRAEYRYDILASIPI